MCCAMKTLQEFKEFAIKGNMVDMAIGIIIGGAFGTIVKSLVDDIIMPIVSGVFKIPDFSNLSVQLGGSETFDTLAAAQEAGAPVLAYGSFINAVIAFFIVARVLFLVIKGINSLKKQEEAKEEVAAGPTELDVLKEIRDSLKKQ